MNIDCIKKLGDVWKIHLVDISGKRSKFLLPARSGETLADAAIRVEDLLRQLQAGQVKPADTSLTFIN